MKAAAGGVSRAAIIAAALLALPAGAVETTQWPPQGDVAARMRQLQGVIMGEDSTAAQREAAREELSKLLKSPAGQARGRTPDEKPVRPRAAIEPLGPMVKPAPNPQVMVPGVAHVDVVIPPRPIVIPQTGAVAAPSGNAAIDPLTGHVLHETPSGYIDPRTGQFTPR